MAAAPPTLMPLTHLSSFGSICLAASSRGRGRKSRLKRLLAAIGGAGGRTCSHPSTHDASLANSCACSRLARRWSTALLRVFGQLITAEQGGGDKLVY